jgi:hypothetical protein
MEEKSSKRKWKIIIKEIMKLLVSSLEKKEEEMLWLWHDMLFITRLEFMIMTNFPPPLFLLRSISFFVFF